MKSAKKIVVKETENAPSFEQAIQRLEKIVAEMESADLPLEDILKRYEEGSRLVRFCGQKLEEAEKKIELLTKKSRFNPPGTPKTPGPRKTIPRTRKPSYCSFLIRFNRFNEERTHGTLSGPDQFACRCQTAHDGATPDIGA
jgi:exodeoxyribonuclease VII small subunit